MENSTIGIIVLICVIILYLTEIIPLAITALLSCIAMGALGASSYKTVFSGYSNDVTLMIIGMSIVGDTLFETGVANFLGKKLIRFFGSNEKNFLVACILITSFLSAFLSNSATVAMMIPIMSSAIASSDGILTKKYTYMPIGFAAVAGGGLTLIGSTPQIIAQGILIEANLKGASFYEYLWTGIPKVLILLVYFMTLGYYLMKRICTFPEKIDDSSKLKINNNLTDKLTINMIISILILFGCVIGFLIQLWTFGMVAMFGAALCIITKCISFKYAFKNLDWNTIILVASALGFASCLDESGAGIVIAESIIKVVGENANPIIVLSIVGILSSLLGNLVSASAATPILAPICLFIAPAMGLNPRTLIIAVVVFSSIVYTSPTSTPPNTMPLVAGYRYMDYVKVGGLLNVSTVILSIILFPMFYSL